MSMCASVSERLIDMLGGHRVTATICAAVELGVIEALATGQQTSRMVATTCATNEAATGRLLTALAALGICEQLERGKFKLSAMGDQLVANANRSLRDWALFEGTMLARSWLGLGDSIRRGKTVSELAGTAGRYEELVGDQGSARLFDAAMISMTRLAAKEILSAHDFSAAGRILDVGGGNGALLIELLRKQPHLTGSVLDLPRCEAGAQQEIENAGLAQVAKFVCGDFFEHIPSGFDTLLLKSVLHNWDDHASAKILANCRHALGRNGTLLVIERFIPEEPEASPRRASHALNDLNMLRGPGGRERTEEEYRRMVVGAGLSVTSAVPTGRYDVLVAMA